MTARIRKLVAGCSLATLTCGPEAHEDADSREALFERAGEACNRACRLEADCFATDLTECFYICFEELEAPDEFATPSPCLLAGLEFWECQDGLTCDELAQLQHDEPNPCSELEATKEQICE